jgi:stress-induced morphogen
MISQTEVIEMIQADLPDAKVDILDKTGMSDHFIIRVVSPSFEKLNLLDSNRRFLKRN